MKTSLVFLCGIIIMLSACNSNKSTDINFKNMETKIREKTNRTRVHGSVTSYMYLSEKNKFVASLIVDSSKNKMIILAQRHDDESFANMVILTEKDGIVSSGKFPTKTVDNADIENMANGFIALLTDPGIRLSDNETELLIEYLE